MKVTKPPMIRRDSVWTATERKQLEEAIVPSPNSVELERTAQIEFLHRLTNVHPNIAELYHENSKLTPHSTIEAPIGKQKLEEVREWFLATAYAIKDEEVDASKAHNFRITLGDLPEAVRSFLQTLSQPGEITNLLYGVDLLLLHGGRLYRMLAETENLWVERSVEETELDKLRAAIPSLGEGAGGGTDSFFFLVGAPWRFMVIYGPRGYRHLLFDAGRLLAYFERQASRDQADLTVIQDFYDTRVDRFLYADGVERSTLAVLHLKGESR